MLNNLVLVGRLTDIYPYHLRIATERPYKNSETGLYDEDIFDVKILSDMFENVTTLKIGDLLGVKGYLTTNAINEIEVVATKLTFLSHKGDIKNDNNW